MRYNGANSERKNAAHTTPQTSGKHWLKGCCSLTIKKPLKVVSSGGVRPQKKGEITMADKTQYVGDTGVVADRSQFVYSSEYREADENRVNVTALHKCKDGLHAYVSLTFDFSETPRESLLEMAAKSAMIAARPMEVRESPASEVAKKLEGKTLDPMDYFKRERRSTAVTPEKIEKAAEKLDKEALAELIAKLQKLQA